MVSQSVEPRCFLSAGIPDPHREPIYYETADLVAIREATRAASAVALKRGRLVFGGHPAISPVVLIVATALDAADRVEIFQSEFFRDQTPPENRAFRQITWTPVVGSNREESLLEMRKQMIDKGRYDAGFFIGGMEGVQEEFALFRSRRPSVPAFPIGSTGAAARLLLEQHPQQLPFVSAALAEDLRNDVVYYELFERLLDI